MSDARANGVYELPAPARTVAASLFDQASFDRALIDSFFEGRQGGRLFVDDAGRPRAALMCRAYDWYLAGDPAATALRRFVAEAPAEAAVFQTLYGCVPVQEAWIQRLMGDSPGIWEIIPRRGFRFVRGRVGSRALQPGAPAGATVCVIDRRLAERVDAELGEHIGLLWEGYERFQRNGFGFCVLLDERPVSAAYAVSVSARYANLAVSTAEPFRRRGFAAMVCSACLAYCLDRGLTAEWDSDASNMASIALATSLGFQEGPPFSELSPPGRAKLRLSSGLWTPAPPPSGSPAAVAWLRRENPGTEVLTG